MIKENFLTILEEKLNHSGIDDSLVKAYIKNYKRTINTGLFEELRFTNDELPSDDSFERLKECNAKEPFHASASESGELLALFEIKRCLESKE